MSVGEQTGSDASPRWGEVQDGGHMAGGLLREQVPLFPIMSTVPPRKGGTTYSQCTVHRCAVPPRGVPGFHQRDARRVSAAGPALRGGVPRPSGGVAPRWEAADGAPVCRV